jgi:hypothetical protein
MFQSSSSSSSSIGDGGGLPGWKRGEWSKQSAGISLVPATEKTVEDDDEKDSEMTLRRAEAGGIRTLRTKNENTPETTPLGLLWRASFSCKRFTPP